MHILNTIVPIFTIIALGWIARQKDFLRPEFVGPANRLVYYLAIPAMIFRSIAGSTLQSQFDPTVVLATVFSVLVAFGTALCIARLGRLDRSQRGTFVQNCIHGNLGYIGLAVVYYYIGNEGLARAGLIAGCLIILQNFLAVTVLQFYSDKSASFNKRSILIRNVLMNPIILAALGGIIVSALMIQLPLIVDRSLKILSDLALPMALLIIGASLSMRLMKKRLASVMVSAGMKLALLPLLGFISYQATGIAAVEYLPGLILLASPTATVTYVMARELNGDEDFAIAGISTSTLFSAATFTFWLNLAD